MISVFVLPVFVYFVWVLFCCWASSALSCPLNSHMWQEERSFHADPSKSKQHLPLCGHQSRHVWLLLEQDFTLQVCKESTFA